MKSFDLKTTTAFVIANMIGTGVFTSLGYQLMGVSSTFAILMLWVIGGIVSFCGALSYVALASHMPRSGGEYHYLTEIYGSTVGFIAGFITVIVGFATPIAAVGMAFGKYASPLLPVSVLFLSALSIITVAAIHVYDVRKGGSFHYWSTLLKVCLIIVFIGLTFVFATPAQPIRLLPQWSDMSVMTSSAFVVSSVYVTYSYTGWNASVYILDEVENPQRNIPLSILIGTSVVTILYLLLNFAFLYAAPLDALRGEIEVGQIAATHAFGETGGLVMSAIIAVGLISALSSMIVMGSRVLKVMAEDYAKLAFLKNTNAKGAPYIAILLLAGLATILVLTATFEAVITYAGFIIGIFGSTAVLGLFVLKYRNPAMTFPLGKWFYPLIPGIYLLINIWIAVYLLIAEPTTALMGLLTLAIGFGVYQLVKMEK